MTVTAPRIFFTRLPSRNSACFATRLVSRLNHGRIETHTRQATKMIKGSCHCQSIRFEIDGKMEGIFHCHCATCQKLNGTSYGSTGFVSADSFRIMNGEQDLTAYESSPGKNRYFCSKCGAPVYTQTHAKPDRIGVRIGLLDADPGIRSTAHICLSHERPWFEVSTALPKFDEFGS